ncbi:MAG: DNA replication/repair protein RecF [Candidatus Dormibacteria bacterium]
MEGLRLYRFRNYAEQTVEFGPGVNVVLGPNAQGKTNLLEAVATLALSRSPRAATAAELISWGAQECQLQARLSRPLGATEVSLRLRRGDAGAAVRTISVDGTPRRARALLGVCPVVLFWPEDLLLVKGGPEGRRRLLDVVLAQLDSRSAADLVRYRRILDQRNALLRRLRLGLGSGDGLGGFTADLAATGGRIRVARAQLVAALRPLARTALEELSRGGEVLDIRYSVTRPVGEADANDEGRHGGGPDGPAMALPAPSLAEQEEDDAVPADAATAAGALAAELEARRAEEIARGITVAGPHRDDLAVILNGRPARSGASQGQQRSIVLALKLAEVRHLAERAGMSPVLILDDVLSELDPGRRLQLLDALGARGRAQVLLSSTEVDAMAGLDLGPVRRHEVRAGVVTSHDVAAARGVG